MEPKSQKYQKVNQHQLVINKENIHRAISKKEENLSQVSKMVHFLFTQVERIIQQAIQNGEKNLSINVINQWGILQFNFYQYFKSWIVFEEFRPILTKTFSFCTFQNIKSIHLKRISIDNCQFLSFLDAPFLQTIFIHQNNIFEIKSFQKLYLPSLIQLLLYWNSFQTITLQRAKFTTSKILIVLDFLTRFTDVSNKTPCQNITPLFKINSSICPQLHVNSVYRINNRKLVECRKRKLQKKD